jgi:SAM-dependent methyltransferase
MLDCGCGTGHAIERFGLTESHFSEIIGIDHSRGMLETAENKLGRDQRVRLIQTDVLEWLAESETSDFQLITAVGFLHHLSDEQVFDALKLMAGRLAPNGQIVIAEPMVDECLVEPRLIRWWNHRSLARRAAYSRPVQEPDERPLPRELIQDAFESAGLRVCDHASSWEVFNHSTQPGWLERFLIGILYRWGGPGIVNAWRLQPDRGR